MGVRRAERVASSVPPRSQKALDKYDKIVFREVLYDNSW